MQKPALAGVTEQRTDVHRSECGVFINRWPWEDQARRRILLPSTEEIQNGSIPIRSETLTQGPYFQDTDTSQDVLAPSDWCGHRRTPVAQEIRSRADRWDCR